MKRIGIIGGLGPESTVDYYKRIIESCRISGSLAAPEMIIYSVNLAEVLDLVGKEEWTSLTYLLVAKLKSLKQAGADFAVISANTPHVVFNEVREKSPLPLLSIVTATLEKTRELGLKKVGLLGTGFTMRHDFFSPEFAREGISVVVPMPEDQEYIHHKLMTEIELGIFTEETRAGLLAIIEKMEQLFGIEGVILGCTELPLILQDGMSRLPLLNTTAIHVAAIVGALDR